MEPAKRKRRRMNPTTKKDVKFFIQVSAALILIGGVYAIKRSHVLGNHSSTGCDSLDTS